MRRSSATRRRTSCARRGSWTCRSITSTSPRTSPRSRRPRPCPRSCSCAATFTGGIHSRSRTGTTECVPATISMRTPTSPAASSGSSSRSESPPSQPARLLAGLARSGPARRSHARGGVRAREHGRREARGDAAGDRALCVPRRRSRRRALLHLAPAVHRARLHDRPDDGRRCRRGRRRLWSRLRRPVGLLALVLGVVVFAAGVARLGFLADLLSRPVMAGFLSGVGITVVVGQLHVLLGLPATSGATLEKFAAVVQHFGETNVATLAIGV